jgi:hypothetical protein
MNSKDDTIFVKMKVKHEAKDAIKVLNKSKFSTSKKPFVESYILKVNTIMSLPDGSG